MLLLVALSLSGCANNTTFHSAFDDLTHDVKPVSTAYLDYQSLISLNGLMPPHTIGMMFEDAGGSFNRDSLSPALLIGISPEYSFVVEASYETENGDYKVKKLRDDYVDFRTQAISVVAARHKAQSAKQIYNMLQAGSRQSSLLDLASSFDFNTKQWDGDPEKAKVAEEQNKTVLGDLDKKTVDKETDLTDKSSKFQKDVDTNMLIMRWVSEQKKGLLADLGSIADSSGKQEEKTSGVMILANIRARALSVGFDFICMMADPGLKDGFRNEFIKTTNIATYMLEAKQVAYISDADMASSINSSLKLSKAQLDNLKANGLLGLTDLTLEVNAIISNAIGVGNSGIMSSPKVSRVEYWFSDPSRYEKSLKAGLSKSDGYQTIRVVRAKLNSETLGKLRSAYSGTDSAWLWKKCMGCEVDRQQTLYPH